MSPAPSAAGAHPKLAQPSNRCGSRTRKPKLTEDLAEPRKEKPAKAKAKAEADPDPAAEPEPWICEECGQAGIWGA